MSIGVFTFIFSYWILFKYVNSSGIFCVYYLTPILCLIRPDERQNKIINIFQIRTKELQFFPYRSVVTNISMKTTFVMREKNHHNTLKLELPLVHQIY